jgi:hypothetical protein
MVGYWLNHYRLFISGMDELMRLTESISISKVDFIIAFTLLMIVDVLSVVFEKWGSVAAFNTSTHSFYQYLMLL